MTEQEPYRQGAFDLPPPEKAAAPPAALPVRAIAADLPVPDRGAGTRLPNDFWAEFLLEWQFRERHGMAPVSPAEFADLRDFSDQAERPPDEETVSGASEPSAGYDDDRVPDAPRDGRGPDGERTVFDARQAKLDATIALLAGKIEQLVTGQEYRAYLRMLARFHPYSANNVALILAQNPAATQVMGYGNKAGTTGWKSLGRYVRQGEKGITIIRPMHRTIPDAETGEPVRVLTGFTTATVFDIAQTEGKPLPQEPLPADLTPDEAARSLELHVQLHRFVDAAGVRVVRDATGRQRGYWNPEKREIGIRADLTGVRALKTLAHETAHLLAAHRRDAVAMEDAETVAESVACVLLDHYGIDTSSYSVPYIAGWARSPAVLQRNLDTVRDLSHLLLTAFGESSPAAEVGEE